MNDTATIGHNNPPDYAKIETARLVDEYRGLTNTLTELVGEIDLIPAVINDDPTALKAGGLIKRFKDLRERMEQTRVVEVEPHLRRQNAINAFFNGLRKIIQPDDKVERRVKPGHIDVLQGRIDAHQERKEAAERERLRLEQLERDRIAREAREKAEREAAEAARLKREAEQRAAEAERARAAVQIAAKAEAAKAAAAEAAKADAAAVAATLAAEQAAESATEARIATLAKPQDIVRTRGVTEQGAGVTLTTAKESYAYVTDRRLLAKHADKLFVHFTDSEVEKALRAYAKATHYDEPLDGAEIGWRRKGITR